VIGGRVQGLGFRVQGSGFRDKITKKTKKNKDVPRRGSFSEHLAIESMGGR
jgi:hypothetical protein